MFFKLGRGHIVEVKPSDCIDIENPEIKKAFASYVRDMKAVSPRADDFLYFTAVMMHAAEASTINPDGTPKKTKNGEDVKVWWEKNADGGLKWCSNDPSIQAYRNSRRDIFPESELIAHHKKWKDKPLCVDHKSDSAEFTRGFIVDTYYDRKLKRVVALCAIDKVLYGPLARKVSTGTQRDVSMGTGVGRAVCYDCGKVARAEKDFCDHMRFKTTYGEINLDLEPIELSIVTIGADPNAKIKHVIASAQTIDRYIESKSKHISAISSKEQAGVFRSELKDSLSEISSLAKQAEEIKSSLSDEQGDKSGYTQVSHDGKDESSVFEDEITDGYQTTPPARIAGIEDMMLALKGIEEKIHKLASQVDSIEKTGQLMAQKKQAFYQGTEEPTPGKTQYPVDPLSVKAREEDAKRNPDQTNGPTGIFKGDADLKDSVNRTASRREEAMKKAQSEVSRKEAWFLGTEEPALGKTKYAPEPEAVKAREEDAKRNPDQTNGPAGIFKGDADLKDSVGRTASRAKLVINKSARGTDYATSEWQFFSGDKLVARASIEQLTGGNDLLFSHAMTKEFGTSLFEKVNKLGAAEFMKKMAQDVPPPPAPTDAPAPSAAPAPEASGPVPPPEPTGPTGPESDKGDKGDKDSKPKDPKEMIKDDVDTIETTISDLKELVSKQFGEEDGMKDLVTAASRVPQLKRAFADQRETSKQLATYGRKMIGELEAIAGELREYADLYKTVRGSQRAVLDETTIASIKEARQLHSDAIKVMAAFETYGSSTELLCKVAEEHLSGDSILNQDIDTVPPISEERPVHVEHRDHDQDDLEGGDESGDHLGDETHTHEMHDDMGGDTHSDGDDMGDMSDVDDMIETRASRNQLRQKLASELVDEKLLEEAHPKGGVKVPELPGEGDLTVVETQKENQDEHLKNVMSDVKVRREARQLLDLVKSGKVTHEEILANAADMIAAGAADAKAIAYYKQYYSSDPEAKEFGAEMSAEHEKHKAQASIEETKVKIARAWKLADQLQRCGLIDSTSDAMAAEVDRLIQLDDKGFDAVKRFASQTPARTKVATASGFPQVGVRQDQETPAVSQASQESAYSLALRGTRRTSF